MPKYIDNKLFGIRDMTMVSYNNVWSIQLHIFISYEIRKINRLQ